MHKDSSGEGEMYVFFITDAVYVKRENSNTCELANEFVRSTSLFINLNDIPDNCLIEKSYYESKEFLDRAQLVRQQIIYKDATMDHMNREQIHEYVQSIVNEAQSTATTITVSRTYIMTLILLLSNCLLKNIL